MTSIVECVPNFSEGRRPEVVDALAAALNSVTGARVLHRTSDADHNRSVITLAGEPDAVCEAAFRGIAKAAELIDLAEHQGVHPRMGAADVVPFVPVRGATMADCVLLAQRLGQRVGAELGIPVYLYEHAATRPERRNLADVRRGGYELLQQTIQLPEREPDYGAAQVGKAGACIIGAREILIAFNVFLDTADVQIAKNIASKIREANGGFAGIKALGLLVNGQAQVSMNITDYRLTSLFHVFAVIARHAQVTHSELIGLLPLAALLDLRAGNYIAPRHWLEDRIKQQDREPVIRKAVTYLRLRDFTAQQIIEVALHEAGLL
jgi:glutamate formiminotransferase